MPCWWNVLKAIHSAFSSLFTINDAASYLQIQIVLLFVWFCKVSPCCTLKSCSLYQKAQVCVLLEVALSIARDTFYQFHFLIRETCTNAVMANAAVLLHRSHRRQCINCPTEECKQQSVWISSILEKWLCYYSNDAPVSNHFQVLTTLENNSFSLIMLPD